MPSSRCGRGGGVLAVWCLERFGRNIIRCKVFIVLIELDVLSETGTLTSISAMLAFISRKAYGVAQLTD